MRIYTDLADWWPLLSSPADYVEEAEHHWRLMSGHVDRPIRTMLELGAGGGNNAVHLKRHCRMTLTDLSPQMLEVSRKLNPECEHIEGDMRTLRLNETFDAVLIHDAVMYLTAEACLRAAIKTAYAHVSPGGVLLAVPDCVRETFVESTDTGGHDGDGVSLRYCSWTHDPDPTDTEFAIDYAVMLRDTRGRVCVEHDHHRNGLFPIAMWMDVFRATGFEPSVHACEYDGGEACRSFIGVRLAS